MEPTAILAPAPGVAFDAAKAKQAFADIGVSLEVRRPREVRGGLHDALLFILETDWEAVRDASVAAAVSAGVVEISQRSAKLIGKAFRSMFGEVSAEEEILIEVRDTRSGRRYSLLAKDAIDEAPWLMLIDTRQSDRSVRWNALRMSWERVDD